MVADETTFEEAPPAERPSFVVDLEGFEGPLDVLLTLARDQKVDLTRISILELADQYLAFVAKAREINLDMAADYLVMAAWLAYLKSRLLLPDLSAEEEPTGEEMAAALAFQLQRLEAMREVGARLLARPRLGQDHFARGEAEEPENEVKTVYQVSLYDVLKAYGDFKRRTGEKTLQIEAWSYHSVEDALARLRRLIGRTPDWENMAAFLPPGLTDALGQRSAVAATLTASLELVREGMLSIRQTAPFGPIYLKAGRSRKDS